MDESNLQKLLFQPQKLAPEIQEELSAYFDVVEIHPKLLQNFHKEMAKFFGTEPTALQSKMKMYYGNYWDWYVRATWKRFLTLSEDELIFHLKSQLPTAFRLLIPMEQKVFHYFVRISIDDEKIKALFEKIQNTMTTSSFPVNPLAAKPITLMDLSKRALALPPEDTASLEFASLYGEMEKQLYADNTQLSAKEKTDYTKAFIDFVRFLTDKKSDILNVLDTYVYEILRDEEEGEIPNDIDLPPEVAAALNGTAVPPTDETEKANDDAPLLAAVVPSEPAPPTASVPSLSDIQNMVDARFEKDETGQYKDLEGVFGFLDQLAGQYNDPKIKEFLYFDENTGGFVWMQA